jgi:hypothetical protein
VVADMGEVVRAGADVLWEDEVVAGLAQAPTHMAKPLPFSLTPSGGKLSSDDEHHRRECNALPHPGEEVGVRYSPTRG